MRKFIIILVSQIALLATGLFAQEVESFSQAKALALDSKKPILLEFGRSDCIYCQKFEREAADESIFVNAIKQVVYCTINVLEDEGPGLKKTYAVGNTYPVFILTDSSGEIITRWTGYSTVGQFVNQLSNSLKDLRTIRQRRADFEAAPDLRQAATLGNFYSDIEEHLEAMEFFRKAEKLGANKKIDLSYDIFRNAANAAWKEQAPLEIVYPEAERVVKSGLNPNIVKMATIMSRLSRKFNRADSLAKYLDIGIKLAGQSRDPKDQEAHFLLVAEHALQISHDTARAIGIKEMSMGENWERNPDKFYEYAKWCLEREINLGEAEYFARQALQACPDGENKALVANTLAEVYAARGNYQGAIGAAEISVANHPENPYYQEQLEKFQELLKKGQ